MLRACELAGRLDFTIEAASQAAIHDLRQELTKASPARVSEELVALLRCGSSGKAMQWMLDLGVLEVLLPEAYAMVQASERGLGDFGKILPTLDRKVAAGRQVSDGGLLAALLLPSVLLRRFDIEALARKALRREQLAAAGRRGLRAFPQALRALARAHPADDRRAQGLPAPLRTAPHRRRAPPRGLASPGSPTPSGSSSCWPRRPPRASRSWHSGRRPPAGARCWPRASLVGASLGGDRAAPPRKRPRRRKRR